MARLITLLTTSALICGSTLALTATPALAAIEAPAGLLTAGQACTTTAPGPYLSPRRLNDSAAVVLQGTFAGGVTGQELQADFQVWDVTSPDDPQQWLRGVGTANNRVYVQLEDDAKQLDGVTYGWRVRVLDPAGTASPWSGTCYFTVDRDGGAAPTVTSDDYPAGSWDSAHGAIGVPGTFTFATTSDDTVGYYYRLSASELSEDNPWRTIPTDGGPATLSWTPTVAGSHWLTVYAVDRAGNYSVAAHHEFSVTETRPSIFTAAYPDYSGTLKYNVGVPADWQFTSNIADTTGFAWRIDGDGPSGTVSVAAREREATTSITPVKAGKQTLYVRSRTADGKVHAERAYEFLVDDGPRLTGDIDRSVIIGSTLRFHLEPRRPKVTSYVYWFSVSGQPGPKRTLKAGSTGSADLAVAANELNLGGLWVQSLSSDGTLSVPRWGHFSISGASPGVSRSGGDATGQTAVFTARTLMTGVVAYDVVFNGDATTRRTVKPNADGSATIRFVPLRSGYNWLNVTARNAAGVTTSNGGTSWQVTASPALRSTSRPVISGAVAVGGTVRASAGGWTPAPGSYRYQWAANGTAIKGATGATYVIPASVLGKRLTVTVIADRVGHPSGTAVATATPAVVKGAAPKATTRPTISGTAKAGKTLTARVGVWSPKAGSYRYEWRVNGKLLKTTTKTLKLTASMKGKKITVTVVALRPGHLNGRATSKAVTVRK
ncbi:hypothetical protein [Actinoplanes derwentensis]|uniref:Ig-like domain (Group 3) n=1 Tax=Actinoplanes derwentensis TaxID=113562 RepID=A0A1H2CX14_9ACTN|nr:hypothetical protein [Actinoplanes derwentensis]GID87882.1 hypothetical protein Ade03nite_68060 [Actinoplanes derwentensis]SDT74904.1 hypothetical protein SAMN04489716_7132 [Actinoplanes derwentensis]